MIYDLKEKYAELATAGARCVFLKGEGRALCAGGDVAEVREGVLTGSSAPAEFFHHEYSLDYTISALHESQNILQVALWDGIVMGGGVGLSIHSPVIVATEKLLFAMPETAIGLFPDVGATWALSRLSAGQAVGLYLGLTGQRLGAADALRAGLATHYCPSDRLPEVEAAICALGEKANDLDAVSATIAEVGGDAKPDMAKAVLDANLDAINRCFSGDAPTAEAIVERLRKEEGEWASKTLATLLRMSPTSVKISLEAIKRHRSVTLKDAFTAEYRLSQWCMRPQPESDFCEGIRAVLVDRDNQPKWQPATLEEVSKDRVDGFFAPLPAGHSHGELKL
jgi:enoyl-CoA hydratase/carnithine racemase